ncbi:MAG: hypothetical protein WAK24_15495 [Candidatus Acidiferrales bacterium]
MQKKRNATAPAALPAKANKAATGKRAQNPTVGARHAVPERPTITAQPSSTTSRRSPTKVPRARKRRRAKPAEQRLKPSPPLTTKDAFAVLFGDATTIAASSSSARAAKPAPIAKSSPPFARAAVKKSAAGKQSPNETVGARPAVPERPASTAQPSSTTPRRSRSKAARLPKRSVILSAAKDLSRPAGKLSRSRSRSRKRKRAQSSPAAAAAPTSTSAAAIAAQPISSAPPPRIRIGDAMRRSGLDEYKVARTFAGVVDKLSDGTKDTGGVQKLLVDVLKECSRHLDAPQSERAAPAAPVNITMVHNVPRPVRTQPPPPQQLNAAPLVAAPAPGTASTTEPAAQAIEPVTKSDVAQSDAPAPPARQP